MSCFEDFLICPECDSDLIEYEKEIGDELFLCRCQYCGCRFEVQECTQYSVEKVVEHGKEVE